MGLGQRLGFLLGTIALCWGTGGQAIAAEVVRLRIGPLQQTLQVEDLETFAKTGELPRHLKPFRGLLNVRLQGFLKKSLRIDPAMAEQLLEQLWRSPTGEQLLTQIQTALPEVSVEGIQGALQLALSQNLEINALNLLRAYPSEELTIDLTAVAGLLMQLNLANLQSQLLSPQVTSALEVPTTLPPQTLDPTVPGTQVVRRRTLILRDHQRDRTIPVDIYDSPQPREQLVVLSHGFAANRHFLDYLAEHLTSYGYIVVTLDHPGSNMQSLINAPLGLDNLLPAEEFIDRPKDISFVLDQLAAMNEANPNEPAFPTENVTVIGHSFGGYTALALAGGTVDPPAIRAHCRQSNPLTRAPGDWLQCAATQLPYGQLNLRDERITQAIALNPMINQIFGEEGIGLGNIQIPTLILTATQDAITPSLTHQLEPFDQLGGEKYLVVADGATHMSVTDLSNRNSLLAQSTLVPEVMGETAEPVRQMLRALSLSFLERHETDGAVYNDFLTGSYVQSLSSDKITLRLTQTISAELKQFLSELPQAQPLVTTPPPTQKAALFSFGQLDDPATQPPATYPFGLLQQSFAPLMAQIDPTEFHEPYGVNPKSHFDQNFKVLYQWDNRASAKR